jgi:glycosyltransferase involved in cell wall biosynthesis
VKVLHYTIGFHFPHRGGVEVAIADLVKMTPKWEHVVMCKNGGPDNKFCKTIPSVNAKTRMKASNKCAEYASSINKIPKSSCEFDESTIGRIRKTNPDIIIVYYDSMQTEMLIPILYFDNVIIRCQQSHQEIDISLINKARRVVRINYMAHKIWDDLGDKVVTVPKVYDDGVFNSLNRSVFNRDKIIYVGRIALIKRLDHLANAVHSLGKELLIVGGYTPSSYCKKVSKVFKNSNVKILPWKTHEELAMLYRVYGTCFIPSRHETFCSTALEALACGCSLAINNGTMSWANEFSNNGYHLVSQEGFRGNDPNPGGIMEILKKVTSKEYEHIDYSDQVFEKFSYSRNSKRYVDAFS